MVWKWGQVVDEDKKKKVKKKKKKKLKTKVMKSIGMKLKEENKNGCMSMEAKDNNSNIAEKIGAFSSINLIETFLYDCNIRITNPEGLLRKLFFAYLPPSKIMSLDRPTCI